MRFRLSLRGKILLCALLNLSLLVGAFLLFLRVQFETGLESVLLAPAQGRIRAVVDEVVRGMMNAPAAGRAELLSRFEQRIGLQMSVFLNNGTPVGGAMQSVPPQVMRLLRAPRNEGPPGPPQRHLRPPWPPPTDGDMWKGPLGRAPSGPGPGDSRGQTPRGANLFLTWEDGSYWIGARVPVMEAGDEFTYEGTLIMRSSNLMNPFLLDLRPWVGGLLVMVGLTLACWLPLIHRLTSAIKRTTAAAGQIASGEFNVKLPANRRDELDQLSEALNQMAVQLDGFVHGQKRFLGDIAHELSAPIARTRVALGILEERVSDPQRHYVDGLSEEVRHMSELVNELLQFSKAGLKADLPDRTKVRIGDVVKRALERESSAGANVTLTGGGDLMVLAHPDALFRALSNVVRNAIRYAGKDGPIEISARTSGDRVEVIVSDNGPGIPEAALERVFAPFYRLDRARTRDTGGSGLGLAIVKSSVEACGGRITLRNRSPHGLEVCISLAASSGSDSSPGTRRLPGARQGAA